MNLDTTVREVLESVDDVNVNILTEVFGLLLRHEYTSAQHALNYNLNRYDAKVKVGEPVPAFIASDLADSMQIISAFVNLMDYYGVNDD